MRGFIIAILCLATGYTNAQVCANNGNLMLYTNYDGGILNINVDQNIPNLKIGICTYEPVQVTLSGTYVGNVTQVVYAGFNSTQNNNNCNQGNFITSITGVPSNIVQIQTIPPASLPSANGYPYIICAYQCDTAGSQGGCNTVDQVVDYFLQQTGGTLYAHHIQYNCWLNTTFNISAGGTCCILPQGLVVPPAASFTADTTTVCAGNCIGFTNTSSGGPFSSVLWSFQGAVPSSSTDVNPTNICYAAEGVYPVSLTVTNAGGTDTTTLSSYITITNPAINASFTYSQINNYNVNFTNTSTGANIYNWLFPNNSTSTDTNATYNFPAEGTYPVTLVGYNNCGQVDSTTINIVVIKSISSVETEELKTIPLYPNPTTDNLHITTPQPVSYIVYDVVGKTLLSGNVLGNANINIALLSKGLYFIRLSANGQQTVRRFVKE